MSKRIELENDCFKLVFYETYGEYGNHSILVCEEYYNKKGDLHRINDGAIIWYYANYANNIISRKIYCINGKRHRLNGPASIHYRRNGIICGEEYYIHNVEYSKEEFDKKINIDRNLKLLNKK